MQPIKLPPPDIRVTAFGEIEPTDRRTFVVGDFYTAKQMRAVISAERERCARLAETGDYEARTIVLDARAEIGRQIAVAIRKG